MSRRVMFVVHAGRPGAVDVAREAASGLTQAGISVVCADGDFSGASELGLPTTNSAHGCELVIVFGGDGTILRGAEFARDANIPIVGVNLGHVGFLAEAEPENLTAVIDAVVNRNFTVEKRLSIHVDVKNADGSTWETWALNDVAIEKDNRERMVELLATIDGRALSSWSCDGILCSTPTGSTAYAFSAGGPVVWPEVEALVLVPISAHSLFARPLVVSPNSTIDIDVTSGPVVISADGRRSHSVTEGSRVTIKREANPIQFARVHQTPFTDRLVMKFELPVKSWRAEK